MDGKNPERCERLWTLATSEPGLTSAAAVPGGHTLVHRQGQASPTSAGWVKALASDWSCAGRVW